MLLRVLRGEEDLSFFVARVIVSVPGSPAKHLEGSLHTAPPTRKPSCRRRASPSLIWCSLFVQNHSLLNRSIWSKVISTPMVVRFFFLRTSVLAKRPFRSTSCIAFALVTTGLFPISLTLVSFCSDTVAENADVDQCCRNEGIGSGDTSLRLHVRRRTSHTGDFRLRPACDHQWYRLSTFRSMSRLRQIVRVRIHPCAWPKTHRNTIATPMLHDFIFELIRAQFSL